MHSSQRSLLQSGVVDQEDIRRSEERIREARLAPNTRSAYRSAWRAFSIWCETAGLQALPATARTVQDFSTWCFSFGYRLETVSLRIRAIAHYHRSAGYEAPIDRELQRHMADAKRHLKERPGGKAALTYELLRRMVGRLGDTRLGCRNRAMLLLGFACGWRRSEVVSLEYRDVRFVPRGMEIWLGASKTDQIGAGRLVGIEPGRRALTCPVRALREWLAVRGHWEGPLFVKFTPWRELVREPLSPRGVVLYEMVKKLAAAVGEDAKRYGAHSLRAGMITEAARHGASESAIMQRTGHRSSQTLRRYIRPATAFDFNPLAGVL